MMNMNYAQKMKRCYEYVEALEEERRKIQVFQRELPLCLDLVTQAIETCRREISGSTTEYVHGGQSDGSEQTSSDGPILAEFIPIKRTSSSDEDEQESHKTKNNSNNNNNEKNGDKKKSDWLRSVQLWNNQSPDPPTQEDAAKNESVVEVRRNGGAFQPFHKEKNDENSVPPVVKLTASIPASTTSSSTENGAKGSNENVKKEEKETQAQRKQRRCWSPELHRRFLYALQQLGGSHVATPKQIREIMKVDGLTNDEVKSHLQKFRLHTRRPTPFVDSNVNAQSQFVVVGGIWMHPPEYATMTTTTSGETASVTPTCGIYTPVAAPIPTVPQPSVKMLKRPKPIQFEERGSHSERGVHSNSLASSSSTQTTTTSPMSKF
ncbi:hypothetical protein SLA2020_449700 [Shorea laevis]